MANSVWASFVIVIFCLGLGLVEPDGAVHTEELPEKTSVGYIVPVEVDEEADRFKHGKKEYYFYQSRLNYYLATHLCENKYKGRLAWIRDIELANFLAEALSETRLDMDTLWTAGRKESEEGAWNWQEQNKKEPIVEDITKEIVAISEVEATDRHCLGFGRADHDLPQFRALACSVERSVLCESYGRPPDGNGSTHPGWITLGKYDYKIFRNRVTWNDSNVQCGNFDSRVKLASVFSFEVAQQLGRYLLIGRPSLENAWIGGKWEGDSYKWMETDHKISSSTNETSHFPPWKGDHVVKTHGCILLDRHVSNITLFVEARCERQRSYICYRDSQHMTGDIAKSDIIIGEHGFRLIFNRMMWEDAYNYCLMYKKYEAKLSEVRDEATLHNLLYVMGDNKTAVQHIWLAGRYNMSTDRHEESWYWESDHEHIVVGEGAVLQWIHNSTYAQEVEEVNVCLNMDRENHKTALHYGASCTEPQAFVCDMPKDKLIELQEAEENNNVETEAPIMPD